MGTEQRSPQKNGQEDAAMRTKTQQWAIMLAVATAAFAALTTGKLFANSLGLDGECAFAACEIAPGGTADFARTFYAGQTYEIVASGSDGARDVDLYVLNSRGQVIKSDTRSNKEARVVFRPSSTGTYTVRLKLARAFGNALCTVIFFKQDGGWNVPHLNVLSAVEKHRAFVATMSLLGHTPRLVRLYGWVMRPGAGVEVKTNRLNYTAQLAIALGDNWATDIDLYVQRGGQLLAYDDDDDAAPVCVFTGSSASTTLTVKYVSGLGPSLILLGIYE
jgi:hypothetical protein